MVETLEHFLFFGWQVGNDAMKEECSFVEETLGRFDAFDDDASRERVQAGVFFGGEIFSGKDDDWEIAKSRRVAQALEDVEASHVRKTEIEDHAIVGIVRDRGESFLAAGGDVDLDVLIAE